MTTDTLTPNIGLKVIAATSPNWADRMNNNLILIDAIIGSYFIINNLQGIWTNSTEYSVNETVVDSDAAVVYICLVPHTSSPVPTTFLEERNANPSFWGVYSTPARFRGEWQPDTAYSLNDFVTKDAQYAIAIQTHTSGTVFSTDVAGGKWSILIDLTGIQVVPDPTGHADQFLVSNSLANAYELVDSDRAKDLLQITDFAQGFLDLDTEEEMRDYIGAGAATTAVLNWIDADRSYIVGTSGAADFAEPGEFCEFIMQYRIAVGVEVSVTIENGEYDCTKQLIGHPDGHRIIWHNSGLNGLPIRAKTAKVEGASGTGATATLVIHGAYPYDIGRTITVAGMNPAGYNGAHVVTNSVVGTSTSTVSFASAESGAFVSGGTIVSDLASLDALWTAATIDPVTGQDPAVRVTAKAAMDVILEAKYKVILNFDGAGFNLAFAISNMHSGNFIDCPMLIRNTGTCAVGISTGISGRASGPGGVGWFTNTTCHGFTNVGWLADYGGVIYAPGMIGSFCDDEGARSDFTGGFADCNDAIMVGAGNYGWRSNHGGYAYMPRIYMRGCNASVEETNSPSMFWGHSGDIQLCRTGPTHTWGGTGKYFAATIKNNAASQLSIGTNGAADIRDIDMDSTELFITTTLGVPGPPTAPTFGIVFTGTSSGSAAVAVGTSSLTGHVRDIDLSGNAALILSPGTTFGTAKSGTTNITRNLVTGVMVAAPYDPNARPLFDTVEISGTNLTIPTPCPQTIYVVQPSGSAGSPITINTMTMTNWGIGMMINFIASRALAGETVTFTDGTDIALGATRLLDNVRDNLLMIRGTSATVVSEIAFANNA